MKNSLKSKYTRFRAYQLGNEGSSFSYFDGSQFTLIEARLTQISRPRLEAELKECGVEKINCLHITSWDDDHCLKNELKEIFDNFMPARIEYPGYDPHTDNAKECLNIIKAYKQKDASRVIQKVDPSYIISLENAEKLGYKNIFYHPKYISENSNNNSTIKLFRSGCFNVASLGDVEDSIISARLRRCSIFANEVDIFILAHHGADNGFTTSAFLKAVRPRIAVCSSNYDNQFDHPKPEIRALLNKYGIHLYTTKTGDIVIKSINPHDKRYQVFNLIANSTEIYSTKIFESKKSKGLENNQDTVRNIYKNQKPFWKFNV